MDCVFVQEEPLMHRFFADPEQSTVREAVLTGEEARHAFTVLRLKPGAAIQVILDSGLWSAEILSISSSEVRAALLSPLPSSEPSLSITLFQGLPKGDKMDFIIQKATELGVSRIVPVLMSRSVAKPDKNGMSHKLERWRRIIREAAKQSGRCVTPELTGFFPVRDLASSGLLPECCVVPWEEAEAVGPLAFSRAKPQLSSLGILIGPEGGIDEEEIVFLQNAGFVPVTLGKRILRTETAALAAVSAFMGIYGEMDA